MSHLCCSMVISLVWMQCFWIIGHVNGCGDLQTNMEGRCCNKCAPGTYVQKFCSKNDETICAPCQEGYYSDQYHSFDRCEKCNSCQQEYGKNCTSTMNAVCTCYPGFLCSDKICSKCEKNKCDAGESPKRTVVSSDLELEYTYSCVDACAKDEYLDEKSNHLCKPRKQCHAHGLSEKLPRKKTRDNVCYHPETKSDEGVSILTVLVCGFVLISLAFLVFVSYNLLRKLWKHRAKNNPVLEVTVNTENLSKEESGLQFIIQDESKDDSSSSFCQLIVETLPAAS